MSDGLNEVTERDATDLTDEEWDEVLSEMGVDDGGDDVNVGQDVRLLGQEQAALYIAMSDQFVRKSRCYGTRPPGAAAPRGCKSEGARGMTCASRMNPSRRVRRGRRAAARRSAIDGGRTTDRPTVAPIAKSLRPQRQCPLLPQDRIARPGSQEPVSL